MNRVINDSENLKLKSEIDPLTKNKRFYQYSNKSGYEHHGSSVVFGSNKNLIAIEYWYLSWRVAHIPISKRHYFPKENETFVRYSGFLYKKGQQRKKKKKRWFVLNDNCLTYHRDENSEPISKIAMDQIKVVTLTCDKKRFELLTPNRVYYLKAENTVTVKIWYKLIKAILKLRKQIKENLGLIKDLDLKPTSILNRTNTKNSSIFLNIESKGLFLFFVSINSQQGIDKILKSNYITDEELLRIPDFQEEFKKLTSLSTCSLIMKRATQRQIAIPHDLVLFWLKKFENIENEKEREMYNSIKLYDPELRNEFLKNVSNFETDLFEAHKKTKNLKAKMDQLMNELNLKNQEIKELKNQNETTKKNKYKNKQKNQKKIEISNGKFEKELLIQENGEKQKLQSQIDEYKKENLQLKEEKKNFLENIIELNNKIEKLKIKQNNVSEGSHSKNRSEKEISEEKIQRSSKIIGNVPNETNVDQNEKEKQLLDLIEKLSIEKKELQEQKFQLESTLTKANNQFNDIEKKNKKLKNKNKNLKKLIKNNKEKKKQKEKGEEKENFQEKNKKKKDKQKEKEKGKKKQDNRNSEQKENEIKYTKTQMEQMEQIEIGKEPFVQLINTIQEIKQYFEKTGKGNKGGYESSNQQLHALIQSKLWQAINGMFQIGLKKKKKSSRNRHIWNVIDSCIREKSFSQIKNTDNFVHAVKFINQYEPFIKTNDQDIFCRAWMRWALNEKLLPTWIKLIKNSASVLTSFYEREQILNLTKLLASSVIVLEELNQFDFTCHINIEVKKKKKKKK
ncbi:dual adapter for phosphotyrosine and 3-phosphotyrosine and 3-phosphoinositide [Anaeramoeba flamelloides]|uniref:Dual adapter for phosphotyrosine and 3-phosphotyrosine and 3-phosphoinositide n=1 Tax=Anaeramoeba flamelloides TaxID=1746091 RepID=A0ABQ8XH21_9EUKA|nr:dual adapter for phosphotyrosine and 3-phosphotyrosine and 3-phosphoinositide [Anaeramoeba flamelloides]